MKYLVLALAVFLAACEPAKLPNDATMYDKEIDTFSSYSFQNKLVKLKNGRVIECLIFDYHTGYSMDCNWNYGEEQDETRR